MKVKITHPHKCKRIATAPTMGEGRDFWIGELTESIEEHPLETHCLHLETQLKDITFLCNMADFHQLQIICRAVTGKIDDSWIESWVSAALTKSKLWNQEK